MNLHRILLFGMITTNAAPLSALPPSWIYLSFQDDSHLRSSRTMNSNVGYTFHFKMITTERSAMDESSVVGYIFHFKMITTGSIESISIKVVGYTFHFKMITTPV